MEPSSSSSSSPRSRRTQTLRAAVTVDSSSDTGGTGGKASLVPDQALHFIRSAVGKRMDDMKNSSNEQHRSGTKLLSNNILSVTGITMVIHMDRFGVSLREKCALGTAGLPGVRYFFETRLTSILQCVYAHGGDVMQFVDFDDLLICSFSGDDHQYHTWSGDDRSGGGGDDVHASTVDRHVKHLPDYQNALQCAKSLELMDTQLSDFDKTGKKMTIRVTISYGQQRMFCLGGYRSKASHNNVPRTDNHGNSSGYDEDEWDNHVFVVVGPFQHDVCSYFGADHHSSSSSLVVLEKTCYDLFHHLEQQVQGEGVEGGGECCCPLTVSVLQDGNYLLESIGPVEVKTKSLEEIQPMLGNDILVDGILRRLVPPMIKLNEFHLHPTVSMFLRFRVPSLLTDVSSSLSSSDATAHRMDMEQLQVLVHAIQAILFENGSFIKQIAIVDNCQVVLSAFWYVPSEFQSEAQLTHVRKQHGETCLLALSVAVALRDKLHSLRVVSSSIGINTGTACVGIRGCGIRSDLAIMGFSVEAAAYLMKIAPDNCIYLSQSVTIQLPFHLLDRLTVLKSRLKRSEEFDSMVAFMYSSRALLSLADTDFYEVHRVVKAAYQEGIRICREKERGSQTVGANARRNALLQFIVVEGCYGSGKKTNLDWILQQAQLDDVTHYSCRLDSNDGLVDFYTVSKMFRLLVRDDILSNASRQKIYIRKLLRDVYRDRLQHVREMVASAMRIAFGVTCDMTEESQDRSSHSMTVHSTMRMNSSRRFSSSTKSKSDDDDSSQNAVDVLSVVADVLGFLLNVKPVIICFYNIHFIDQSSAEAITRLATSLRSRSLFVFAASPSSEQFDYALFHSSLHLIKQQPSLKYPDASQKFSGRCYLQWYSGLRETLLTRGGAGKKGEGGAQFILIDELDDTDMRDKIKNAIVVSRLNDRINNNDKEYESVIDIPKVLTRILQYTGVNMFWFQMCLELVKQVGLKQFFHIVDIERKAVYIKEEDISVNSASFNEIEETAFPTLDTSTVYPQSLVPDMLKFRKLLLSRYELLSPTEQVVLLSATVMGFTFTSSAIVSLCPIIMSAARFNSQSPLSESAGPIKSTDVANCMASFVQSNWIIETSFVKQEFRFSHPIIYLNLRSLITLDQLDKVHVEMIKTILLKKSKLDSDYYLLLTMHFSHVKASNALDNTIKAVVASLRPTNIKPNTLLVLELLHFSQAYCSSSIDAMILGKAILLIRMVLKKYLHELSSLEDPSATGPSVRNPDSCYGCLMRAFMRGKTAHPTNGKLGLVKFNSVAPDEETSFNSNNSSNHSGYSSVTAIIRTQQVSKNEPPLRFTASATLHILDLLEFLRTSNDALCASFGKKVGAAGGGGVDREAVAAGWQINTLETLEKLQQRHSSDLGDKL